MKRDYISRKMNDINPLYSKIQCPSKTCNIHKHSKVKHSSACQDWTNVYFSPYKLTDTISLLPQVATRR